MVAQCRQGQLTLGGVPLRVAYHADHDLAAAQTVGGVWGAQARLGVDLARLQDLGGEAVGGLVGG